MIQTEFRWRTSDGQRLYGRTWQPVEVRASLLIVHGLSDHIDRYDEFARFLCQRGIRVIGYDQRGHGKSTGLRGHSPSFARLLLDLGELWQEHMVGGSLPYLYGHSLGGCVVLNFVMRPPCPLPTPPDGVIASSPLLRPARRIPWWKEWTARAIHRVLPFVRFSTSIDPTELTHDPRVIDALQRDPYWHRRVSVRLGVEMLAAGEWAYQHPDCLKTPTLVMHGDQDCLTSLQACRDFCRANSRYCQFVEFPGMRHELHHESGNLIVWKTVAEWIEKRAGVPRPAGAASKRVEKVE